MSEKIAKLGIKRDNKMMYFVKGGDVWMVPRKQPGNPDAPKGKPVKVASPGFAMDYTKYIYFVDKDGDAARAARQVGGSKRSKKGSAKAAPKKAAKKAPAKKAAPKAKGKKKK